MVYLTTTSTHFIYGNMAHMVKDHTDNEKGNPFPLLHGLSISNKASFISIPPS